MKRRDFLKRTAPVITLPILLNGLPVKAFSRAPALERLAAALSATDRILVLVQLTGGNDGLNTVIPLDQYPAYTAARANIAIPENAALALTPETGLHPIMTGMASLYQAGKLAVIQGVSYPNPNLSHFRATDIWLSGSSYNEYLRDGWLGRFLDIDYPGYPEGYPNPAMPDPLAIQIGAVVSTSLQGPDQMMAIAIQDPDAFYALVNGVPGGGTDDPPQTPAGRELTYIRHIQQEAQQFSTVIKAAADKAANKATWPTAGTNPLADQLRIVARLIGGGLKTRIYVVSLGGFDTHSGQVQTSPTVDTTLGSHAKLLGRLSDAVSLFMTDCALLGVDDRVLGMTFSEFGRRVVSNASHGTDHGTAAPVFLFGSRVRGGVVGGNPSLTNLDNGNLKMQFDYRQIYSAILQQWFGMSVDDSRGILLRDFAPLPLITTSTGIADTGMPAGFALEQNHPNPFLSSTTIRFSIGATAEATLTVHDAAGRRVALLAADRFSPGIHERRFNAADLPAGLYICRLETGGMQTSMKMLRR